MDTSKDTPDRAAGSPVGAVARRDLQLLTTRVSLVWLLLSNLVGLLLAAMLLLPDLNRLLAPLTYGRWMPLHTDWLLFGWTTLPLLGLLSIWYFGDDTKSAYRGRLLFGFWSAGLVGLGLSWLAGRASGKPFLNATGPANLFFALCLSAAWLVVLRGWLARSASVRARSRSTWIVRTIILIPLGLVPWVLYLTADPAVYPPINPQSGGATGHSLLASTLGIVALMGILPGVGLGLKRTGEKSGVSVFWGFFGLSVLLYALIGHGNVSNRDWGQILGLGSLCLWPWLTWRHWGSFLWSADSAAWRKAFFVWWALLAANGWIQFFPGVLDLAKFSNALVAHAHLAMAGMVTALNMVLLIELADDDRCRAGLTGRGAYWCWNGATALLIGVLLAQGWREGHNPGVLVGRDFITVLVYAVRFGAGLLMAGAGAWWLTRMVSARGGER